MSTLFTIEIDVEVTGDVRLGSRPHYSTSHGNWLPGDAPEVKNLKVMLGGVDITEAIGPATRMEIESGLIEDAISEECA